MLPDDAIEKCGLTPIILYNSSNQILHRQNQALITFTPRHADRLSHEDSLKVLNYDTPSWK